MRIKALDYILLSSTTIKIIEEMKSVINQGIYPFIGDEIFCVCMSEYLRIETFSDVSLKSS